MTEGVHDRRTDSDQLPPFSEPEVATAQPVVPFARISLRERMGSQWLSLRREFGRFLQDRKQVQLLILVVAVGLFGGIVGGLAAARQQSTESDVATMSSFAGALAAESADPVVTEKSGQLEPNERPQSRRVRRSEQAYQFAVIYGDAFFDREKKRRKAKRFRRDDDD